MLRQDGELNFMGQMSAHLRTLGIKAKSVTQITRLPFKTTHLVQAITEKAGIQQKRGAAQDHRARRRRSPVGAQAGDRAVSLLSLCTYQSTVSNNKDNDKTGPNFDQHVNCYIILLFDFLNQQNILIVLTRHTYTYIHTCAVNTCVKYGKVN